MSTVTGYAHIEQRSDGRIWLTGTQTKLIEVVLDRLAHHWDADEIQRQHEHLTLGQIYSCLAYYYDHQAAVDKLIEEQVQRVEEFRQRFGKSILPAKLEANDRVLG